MKVWKDKAGNWISAGEFVRRFKQGVSNITPMQRLENDMRATLITIIGLLAAIAILIWKREVGGWLSYALIFIFIGNTYSSVIKYLTLRSQYIFIKNIESQSINNHIERGFEE